MSSEGLWPTELQAALQMIAMQVWQTLADTGLLLQLEGSQAMMGRLTACRVS